MIANVTSARSEVQLSVCRDGALHLLLYLCASEVQLVQAAATRAIANLTQAIDNEPAIREARAAEQLYSLYHSGSADVKWQAKRALANLEASRILIGLRRYGGAEAPLVDAARRWATSASTPTPPTSELRGSRARARQHCGVVGQPRQT